jgi:hypothetical protein
MTYNKVTQEIITEASSMQFKPARGLCLKSHRTGRVIPFLMSERNTDPDGDITFWVYKPLTDGISVHSLVILND